MQEIRKEKYTNFLNLKNYEEQADQIDLSQRNKSNKFINSTQYNSKVTEVKWPKDLYSEQAASLFPGFIIK